MKNGAILGSGGLNTISHTASTEHGDFGNKRLPGGRHLRISGFSSRVLAWLIFRACLAGFAYHFRLERQLRLDALYEF
jgi:hypothetical protein